MMLKRYAIEWLRPSAKCWDSIRDSAANAADNPAAWFTPDAALSGIPVSIARPFVGDNRATGSSLCNANWRSDSPGQIDPLSYTQHPRQHLWRRLIRISSRCNYTLFSDPGASLDCILAVRGLVLRAFEGPTVRPIVNLSHS